MTAFVAGDVVRCVKDRRVVIGERVVKKGVCYRILEVLPDGSLSIEMTGWFEFPPDAFEPYRAAPHIGDIA